VKNEGLMEIVEGLVKDCKGKRGGAI